jgi:hypothetical protein
MLDMLFLNYVRNDSCMAKKYLKGDTNMDNYLNLEVNSNDGIWSKDETGQPKADHSHWIGFKNRTAKGLRFETLNSGN